MRQSRAHQVTGSTVGQRSFFVWVAGYLSARDMRLPRCRLMSGWVAPLCRWEFDGLRRVFRSRLGRGSGIKLDWDSLGEGCVIFVGVRHWWAPQTMWRQACAGVTGSRYIFPLLGVVERPPLFGRERQPAWRAGGVEFCRRATPL